jgi:hypothetical protein
MRKFGAVRSLIRKKFGGKDIKDGWYARGPKSGCRGNGCGTARSARRGLHGGFCNPRVQFDGETPVNCLMRLHQNSSFVNNFSRQALQFSAR